LHAMASRTVLLLLWSERNRQLACKPEVSGSFREKATVGPIMSYSGWNVTSTPRFLNYYASTCLALYTSQCLLDKEL
jgi:hypothetical protein